MSCNQGWGTRSGVVDWHDFEQMMPFSGGELARRRRIELFREMDTDDNGLLHISEAVRAFFRRVPGVRGIIDTRHVWTMCFRLARGAVKPVVPIGIDFMDQHQFRVLLMTVWVYLRLWESLWKQNPRCIVQVRPCDVPVVEQVLETFGYYNHEEAHGIGDYMLAHFQEKFEESMPFDDFVDVCFRQCIPKLASFEQQYEEGNAVSQLRKIQPALLAKFDQVGRHGVQSLESLQHRMTGFAVRQEKKDVATAAAPTGVAKMGSQQWITQYAFLHTASKFSPQARGNPDLHPCKSDPHIRHRQNEFNPPIIPKSYSAVDLHWDSSHRKSLSAAGNTIMESGSPQARGIAKTRFLSGPKFTGPYRDNVGMNSVFS